MFAGGQDEKTEALEKCWLFPKPAAVHVTLLTSRLLSAIALMQRDDQPASIDKNTTEISQKNPHFVSLPTEQSRSVLS